MFSEVKWKPVQALKRVLQKNTTKQQLYSAIVEALKHRIKEHFSNLT